MNLVVEQIKSINYTTNIIIETVKLLSKLKTHLNLYNINKIDFFFFIKKG